jgi:multidrug efflux pump subunit AcrA (membrane-fusion protein)
VLLAAAVVLPGLTAASCGADERPVALASAQRGSVAEVVDVPATVTARAAATLSAPADGTLAELRVAAGDTVRAGQVLAVVDSPATRDRLTQARRSLDAAQRAGRGVGGGTAGLARAQRGTDQAAEQAFDAARDAAGKVTDPKLRAALLAQVKSAQSNYAAAAGAARDAVRAVDAGVASLGSAVGALSSAQRLQAQQAYDLAKSAVDALTLRAPIGGVVQFGGGASGGGSTDALAGLLGAAGAAGAGGLPAGAAAGVPTAGGPPVGVDVAVPEGGRVTAGTPLLTVVDLSELGLVAEVDETDVLLVKAGVPGAVEFDAVRGASYPARVSSVDVLPTAAARGGVSYRARLSLGAGTEAEGGSAPTPRPGMNAVVHLRVREATEAVTVPAAAVFSADGRDTVWVERSGRADQVHVTVGVQGSDVVQIVRGVEPGQRVVVGGTDRVRPGQRLP